MNPSVMHAAIIIDECEGDRSEALKLVRMQLRCCPRIELQHWKRVYAVLCGEVGGQA
jgi:hypothetical protein